MPRTIHLAASLPASPDELFDMYLDPGLHAAVTGAPVSIGAHAGAEFSAFDGALQGTILQVVQKRLIVQSWRASHWKASDIDSTLILTFWPEGRGARIEIVHANVADHDFAGVSEGWELYYWTPWREYLKKHGARGKGKAKPRRK
jgi:activator of HSP90 ATPase